MPRMLTQCSNMEWLHLQLLDLPPYQTLCWIIQTFLRASSVNLRLSFVYLGSDQRCRAIRLGKWIFVRLRVVVYGRVLVGFCVDFGVQKQLPAGKSSSRFVEPVESGPMRAYIYMHRAADL